MLECDGEQHFRAIPFFGGEEAFLIQKEKDFIKEKYVIDNKLTLIRLYSSEIKNDNRLDKILDSSTTIEMFGNMFKNILLIRDGKLLLAKGKYLNSKIVEYTQASGNGNEKDMV